jgi:hypothetical protein
MTEVKIRTPNAQMPTYVAAAFASTCPSPIVLTSDPGDLAALAEHSARPITIARG